jgi:hypothetical protein
MGDVAEVSVAIISRTVTMNNIFPEKADKLMSNHTEFYPGGP